MGEAEFEANSRATISKNDNEAYRKIAHNKNLRLNLDSFLDFLKKNI